MFTEGLLSAGNFTYISQLNPLPNPASRCYHSHFPDEKTEAHKVSQWQSPDLQPDQSHPWFHTFLLQALPHFIGICPTPHPQSLNPRAEV